MQSPVRVCVHKLPGHKISTEDLNKYPSLLADIWLPQVHLEKLTFNSLIFDKPLSHRLCGFRLSKTVSGKLETYIKLDKLGKGTYATIHQGKSKLTEALWHCRRSNWSRKRGCPAPPPGK